VYTPTLRRVAAETCSRDYKIVSLCILQVQMLFLKKKYNVIARNECYIGDTDCSFMCTSYFRLRYNTDKLYM